METLIALLFVVSIVLLALAINDIVTPTYLWVGGAMAFLIALLLEYLKSAGAIK